MKINTGSLVSIILITIIHDHASEAQIVLNTWGFGAKANEVAYNTLLSTGSPLDAVEKGCNVCELKKNPTDCDGTVGWGGSPDETGETTLDALIFDGTNMVTGSVGDLRQVKEAISVARAVMDHTHHALIVGESATNFAVEMGFHTESLTSNYSKQLYTDWKGNNCQPNYWHDVVPDPKYNCGPYTPEKKSSRAKSEPPVRPDTIHDTLGMIAVTSSGRTAAGVSSNGASHKIAGRVGDSPLPGAGGYADDTKGAAVATGDGGIMLRFLPTFLVVELMGQGVSPQNATEIALQRIGAYYSSYSGAIVAVNSNFEYGAACVGFSQFQYCINNGQGTETITMSCKNPVDKKTHF